MEATSNPTSSAASKWKVVIFAARESLDSLRHTFEAAVKACGDLVDIDILINGNAALADEFSSYLTSQKGESCNFQRVAKVQVWSIALGDKANAWNQYIQRIWRGEEIVFFIDGYVRLNADALDLLGNAVMADTRALGGTGVPTVGRSAKALRQNLITNGGFHGNLCCIKASVLFLMQKRKCALPVGLYRTDSLMGAMLCYALDPSTNVWDDARILVNPNASWQVEEARWWCWREVNAFFKRRLRQARGRLENLAFANHFAKRRRLPEALPPTARELVLDWVHRHPAEARAAQWASPLLVPILRQLRNSAFQPSIDTVPRLIWPGQVAT